jgi:biopolymer transport protein ExbD
MAGNKYRFKTDSNCRYLYNCIIKKEVMNMRTAYLIFFILAAVGFSRQPAVSQDIPKARTGTPQGREILMITLDQSGEVYVEQELMLSKEQFKRKLEAYRQQNLGGLMVLYASENARYNQVVQVLDFLREVGVERVALATLEPTAPPPVTLEPTAPPPGFNPYQRPGTSIPGITPTTPRTSPSLEGIPTNPNLEGIPTNPNQQQGLPNFNGSSPGNLQHSLPGETGVSPNPDPTTSPRESNAAPEN